MPRGRSTVQNIARPRAFFATGSEPGAFRHMGIMRRPPDTSELS
jgi:hypothetical protein